MTAVQPPPAPDNNRSEWRSEWRAWQRLVFVGCVLVYVGLAAFQLRLPGLEYDEAIFGPAALGCTQDFLSPASPLPLDSAARFSPLAFSPFAVRLGSHAVPLMVTPYQGALKVYLLAAVLSVWDVSVRTLRLPNVLVGGLTLVFFGLCVARLFGVPVALLGLAFLATDPSYIFYTRHDFNPSALVLVLVCAPLWCLARWVHTRQTWLWAGAFFLAGLGVYNRLDSSWFLLAAGATGLGYWRQSGLPRLGPKEVLLAGGCFVLGCGPYLFFVWQRPTIAASVRSVAGPPHELLAAAQVKGYVLWTVLNGRSLYDFFADRSGINVGRVVTPDGDTRVGSYVASQQPLLLSSLLTGSLTPYCVLGLLVGMWWVRPPPELQALGVFLACLAACVLVVQGALRGHHFVLFVPFVQAFVAAGLLFLRAQLRSRWARTGLVGLGLAIVSANLGLDYRYHRLLAETGGRGIWSDAIYDLTGYLQQRCPTQRCFIGDWGLGTQVLTLAGGQLAIEEMFWPYINTPASPPQQQRQEHQLLQLLQPLGPAAAPLFVFYTDPYVNFSRPKRLVYTTAKKAGLELRVEQVFKHRDGIPVMEVISLHTAQDTRRTLPNGLDWRASRAPGQPRHTE